MLDAATAALARAAHPSAALARAALARAALARAAHPRADAAPALAFAAAFAAAPLQDAAAYVHRLAVRQRFSPPCAVLALCYLERVAHAFPLTSNSARRLILTALLVAAKFHDDHIFSNRDWAASDAISVQDLNSLEVQFLKALDWRAALSQADYLTARARLLAEHVAITSPGAAAPFLEGLTGLHGCQWKEVESSQSIKGIELKISALQRALRARHFRLKHGTE
jgi:hypothetical protein